MSPQETPAPAADPNHERRWVILGVLALAQLMVVVDATIVNIALPSAQADLGFSDANRQWIVTAYALAFGGLLLLGGKIGDLFGRRRVFIIGLLGFGAASALGGIAQSFNVLVAARALQGVFGALLAPAALALLTVSFNDPTERARAFGIFGAVAGGGAAVGLLLGGVLTQTLSWRWCLYVMLVIAVPVAIAARALLSPARAEEQPRIDIPGALTVSLGLFALVYGFSRAETDGWTDSITLASLALAVVLLSAFVAIQRRVAHPLLPLRIVLDRTRGGALATLAIASVGIFAVFLFLTYYLQGALALTPIQTGLAFLPMVGGILVSSTATGALELLVRVGPRLLATLGMAVAAAGMFYLAQLEPDSAYLGGVLPALVVVGTGLGLVFAVGFQSATTGVEDRDAGVASASVNTVQQIGGAVGTALLSTLAASATTRYLTDNAGDGGPPAALRSAAEIQGYTTAFWISAAIFALGALVAAALLPPRERPRPIVRERPAPRPATAAGAAAAISGRCCWPATDIGKTRETAPLLDHSRGS